MVAAPASAARLVYSLLAVGVLLYALLTPTNVVWGVLVVVLLRLLLVAERIERHLGARASLQERK